MEALERPGNLFLSSGLNFIYRQFVAICFYAKYFLNPEQLVSLLYTHPSVNLQSTVMTIPSLYFARLETLCWFSFFTFLLINTIALSVSIHFWVVFLDQKLDCLAQDCRQGQRKSHLGLIPCYKHFFFCREQSIQFGFCLFDKDITLAAQQSFYY